MIGTIVKMVGAGSTLAAANGAIAYGIKYLADKAATKAAEHATVAFWGVVGTLGAIAGTVELWGAKKAFHDHADVTVKALGLESSYEVAPKVVDKH